MTNLPTREDTIGELRLADLRPHFSVVVMICTTDDPAAAFGTLRRFLRRTALERGRALSVRLLSETGDGSLYETLGPLDQVGIDDLYGLTREARRRPSWTAEEESIVDIVNELTITLRRNRLVAVHSEITSDARLRRWVHREAAPFRFIPQDVLASAFRGNGKMLWVRGVHPGPNQDHARW